jgi:predicted GIY-YIG superfamily endonuclease
MSTFAVYVLLLKNNKRYVGRTSLLIAPENWNSYNPLLDQSIPRIKAHFDGNGTEWTKKYPPVKVEDIYQNCFAEDEDKYTKILMRKFGIENVRGGAYCQLTLDPLQIIFFGTRNSWK